jgi:hypothetical protein
VKGKRLRLAAQLLLGGALMLAIWALLVWVASRPALKRMIDLTPQQVNSVDPATEELLRELRTRKAEIEFHLFLPPLNEQPANDLQQQETNIRRRLHELTMLLLRRYQFLGGESVKVLPHDFYANVSDVREAAQRFDYKSAEGDVLVVAVRMPGKALRYRKLSLALDLAEIGLPSTGPSPLRGAALPVLKRYLGEKQISSSIKGLLVEGTPVAYLLREFSTLLDTTGGFGHGYSAFLGALTDSGFEVREWKTIASPQVPEDAALVLVIEPDSELPDTVAQALFDYVKRGGRLFLDYCYSDVEDHNPTGGKLAELLGFALTPGPVFHKIVDSYRSGGRALDGDVAVARVPVVPGQHPATRRFRESGRPLEVANARAVRPSPDASPAFRREALLSTGDKAWLARRGNDGRMDLRSGQVTLGAFDVGMAFEVDVPTDAKKPDAPKVGQVVLVSGIFCNNAGWPVFGDLAMNICNWLTERRVLLDLKTPVYEATYLQAQPQQLERAWWLLICGVPGGLLVVGFTVLWRRRQ